MGDAAEHLDSGIRQVDGARFVSLVVGQPDQSTFPVDMLPLNGSDFTGTGAG